MSDSSPNSTACEYIQPIPCKNIKIYNELNTLIYEYLEVNGLEQALRTFSKECLSKNLPCPQVGPEGENEVKAAFTHYDGQQLLKSFDEGDLESFLKLWKQFQTHIQVTSEDMKKLEVYLRVHFAIWPKAQDEPEPKQQQAMQHLKTFFEEHSESLSSDATILPLFALPFVSDPRPHPIFKDLFQASWKTKLRGQLETTVNKYFELLQENITSHCKLAAAIAKSNSKLKLQQNHEYSLPSYTGRDAASRRLMENAARSRSLPQSVDKKAGAENNSRLDHRDDPMEDITLMAEYSQAVSYHKDRFFQLLAIHKKQRKVLRGIRENYGKLLKVSSFLYASLEKPEGLSLDHITQQCFQIYPDIFTNPSTSSATSILSLSISKQPDIEHFKKLASTASSTALTTDASDVGLLFLGMNDIGVDTLNYEKIKADLISESRQPTEKLCLLQSLRWLITKTSLAARSQVLLHFTENDLLGLHSGEEIRSKLFSYFLSPTPTYQKESLSRLVNAIASTWAGRSYLTSTDQVATTLIKSLATFKTQEESFICHMVIATLQKLSLRRNMRLMMIEKNVIPWLVRYVKTELDRDLVREEVSQVVLDEAEALSHNNNDISYGDTTFNNYLMEYAWALLMNLCLHSESIQSALTVDFEFLHCIVIMLTSKFSVASGAAEFIPYVLSTLFSLLRNPELFDKAKTMKLDKKLGAVLDRQPPEIANHMRLLLDQLYEKENVDRLMALGETEYDDTDNPDPEELETELELQESWMTPKNEGGLLTGDNLLIKEYLLQANSCSSPPLQLDYHSQTNNNDTDASNSVDFSTEFKLGIILRPKTPTRGRTSHTTIMKDSCPTEPLPSLTQKEPEPSPQPLKNRPLTPPPKSRKVSVGKKADRLTPHPPILKKQKTVVSHLRHSKAFEGQVLSQFNHLTGDQGKESSLPLHSPPAKTMTVHYALSTPIQQLHQLPTKQPTTIDLDENAGHDDNSQLGECDINSLRESPLISFNTPILTSLKEPSPSTQEDEQRSILISYVDSDDDTKNNTDNKTTENGNPESLDNGGSLI